MFEPLSAVTIPSRFRDTFLDKMAYCHGCHDSVMINFQDINVP
ncbi:MAG: hypothetical protein VX435_04350 [Planctomycetota bacterium]|nr:hypothetical protein [Planctomycetota bacterium]